MGIIYSLVELKSDENKLMPRRIGKVVSQDGEVVKVEKYLGFFEDGEYRLWDLVKVGEIVE